jgi:hypothetical protein
MCKSTYIPRFGDEVAQCVDSMLSRHYELFFVLTASQGNSTAKQVEDEKVLVSSFSQCFCKREAVT